MHFVACNANVSLAGMHVPHLRVVTILFPDPWSRRRHANRRVVTPAFVKLLADVLVQVGEGGGGGRKREKEREGCYESDEGVTIRVKGVMNRV